MVRWLHAGTIGGLLALQATGYAQIQSSGEPRALAPVQDASEACFSFSQAIDLAVTESQRVRLARAAVDEAQSVRELTRSTNRLRLDAYGSTLFGDADLSQSRVSNQLALQARKPIFDFSRNRLEVLAAEKDVDRSELVVQAEREESVRTAGLVYFDGVMASETIEALEEERASLSELAEAMKSTVGRGAVTVDQISNIEAQVATVESVLIQARLSVDAAKISLERLIGVSVPRFCTMSVLERELTPADRETSYGDLLDFGASAPLGVRAAELDVDKQELLKENAERYSRPLVEGYAALSYSNDSFSGDWRWRDSLGVQFSMPIMSGGAKKAQIGRASAQLRQAEIRLEIAVADHRESVLRALRLYYDRRAETEARTRSVETKRQQVAYITEAFEGGYRTLDRLVDVRSELTGMYRQELRSRLDLLQAAFELDLAAWSISGKAPYLPETD